MSKLYFFTELDLLNSQTANQAYGPVLNSETTHYRVTSLHSATGQPMAYAMMDGMVLVQESSPGSNTVSLILRPTSQPAALNFARVKYIIYRGIFRQSLISPNGQEIAPAVTNDLTEEIWRQQNMYNVIQGTNDPPSSRILGIHLSASAQGSDLFLDQAELARAFDRKDSPFQLPVVKAGMSIGGFEAAGFGIEILTSGLGWEATFGEARRTETIIQVPAFNPQGTDSEKLENLHQRERILNYIDPCAFFGLFFREGMMAKIVAGASFVPLENADHIYSLVQDKFFTKDFFYLDIRNEHNHSLNYYRNFGEGREVRTDVQPSGPVSESYDTHDWPIYRRHVLRFVNPGATSDISLRIHKGGYEKAAAYVAQDFYQDMLPNPRNRLRNVDIQGIGDHAKPVVLSIPRDTNGSTLCYYLSLRFLRRIPDPGVVQVFGDLVLRTEHYIDNLFALDRLVYFSDQTWKFPDDLLGVVRWHITDEDVYVDEGDLGYIARVGIAEDPLGIYLFCYPTGESLNNGGMSIPIQSGVRNSGTFFSEVIERYFNGVKVDRERITLSQNNVKYGLSYHMNPAAAQSIKLAPTEARLILIAFHKNDDAPTLLQHTTQPGQLNARLAVRDFNRRYDTEQKEYYTGTIKISRHSHFGGQLIADFASSDFVFYQREPLKMLGTEEFSEDLGQQGGTAPDILEFNRQNFELVTAKGTYLRIRKTTDSSSEPVTRQTDGSYVPNPNHNIITVMNGEEIRFRLLGLKPVGNQTWYYIEFMNAYPAAEELWFPDGSNEVLWQHSYPSVEVTDNLGNPVSVRGWIHKSGVSHIAASYDKFMTDLRNINRTLNESGNSYSNASPNDDIWFRMMRLRQMSHGTDINYDWALDTEDLYPSFVPGPYGDALPNINTTPVRDASNPDPQARNEDIFPNLVLFHNYTHFFYEKSGINLFNEQPAAMVEHIDIQHTLVQMDGTRSNYFHQFSPGTQGAVAGLSYELNTGDAIWTGDMASVAADKDVHKKIAWEKRFVYKKRTHEGATGDWQQILDDYDEEVRRFYFKSGVPDKDLISDMIGIDLLKEVERYVNTQNGQPQTSADDFVTAFDLALKTYMNNQRIFLTNSIASFLSDKGLGTPLSLMNMELELHPAFSNTIETPMVDMTDLFWRYRTGNFLNTLPARVVTDARAAAKDFADWLEKRLKGIAD